MKTKKILMLVMSVLFTVCVAFTIGCKKQTEAPIETPPQINGGYEIVTKIDNPTIDVLTGVYSSGAPNAVINKPYKIFDAKAYDAFGVELDVNVSVWRFYFSETASVIDYEDEFIPTAYGVYTVEYSATDKIGNKSVVTYNFECKEKEELSATLETAQTECFVGETIEIADISFDNAVGEVECRVYALSEDSGVKTEVNENTILPTYTGSYKIIYEVKDYNESVTLDYTVIVKEYDKPRIYGDVVLNKYYIKGCEYKLPELDCVSYLNGEPAKISPEVYVIYDGDVPEKVDSNSFIPEKEGSFRIKYVASLNGKTEERMYQSVVVDTGLDGDIKIENYFQSDSSVQITPLDYGIRFSSREETCRVNFINPLLSRFLETKFTFNENNNFEQFNFYLEDSLDSSIVVKFSLVKIKTGEVMLQINDGQSLYKTTSSLNGVDTYTFAFDEQSLSVVVAESTSVLIKKDYNGNVFKGFTSGRAYLSYEMSGVKSNSSFSVETIDNQPFFEGCSYSAPYVVYTRYSEGFKKVGDLIEIQPIYVGGVLLPDYELDFYITAPDGSSPIDVNGVALEKDKTDYSKVNSFVVTQIGKYSVNIKVSNIAKDAYYSFVVVIADDEPPVITLEGEIKDYELGEKIDLLKATVTDNISQSNVLTIYVYKPDGILYKYDGQQIKLDQVGEYTVYYQAMDEAENVSIISYKFKVVD